MNTTTVTALRDALLLGSNDDGDDIYQGDIFRSNDPRDGARPPYEAVDAEGGRIVLRARPELAMGYVRPGYAAETKVMMNRFFKTTQKGWSLF